MTAFLSIRLDAEAQQRALSCLPLAYHLAHRFAARTSLSREDAEAAAVDALLHAATRFDPGRGCKFSTLAHLSIRRRLIRAVDMHVRQSRRMRSFSALNYDDEEPFDPPSPVPDENADDNPEDARALLRRVQDALPPRLWRVAWLHFGKGLTLAEVGREIGVCKERIRQMCAKALCLARAALEAASERGYRLRRTPTD